MSCWVVVVCSLVAFRTSAANRDVAWAAFMMSRDARACSVTALVTSCVTFRICAGALHDLRRGNRLLRRGLGHQLGLLRIVPTPTCTTDLPAARCSSVARAICPTTSTVSLIPARILRNPAAPLSAIALLSSATRSPSLDAATASCTTSCSALMIAGDVGSGFRRAIGQVTNFLRNHREAAAGVTGPGRFDRRVERQQVGAFRNQVDRGRRSS